MTTPTPEELIAELREGAPFQDAISPDALYGDANLIESLSAQVAQLQGERAALGSWGPIPRYAMLDIWTGLKGHPNSFDAWADSVGYAEAWAQLCQWVRQEVTVPAALGAATQPENEGEVRA